MGEDASGNVCRIDSLGNLIKVKTADNTYGGYCNYFHKLPDFKSVNLPALIGATIRVSIGKIYKMKINTENPHAAYTDADFKTLVQGNYRIVAPHKLLAFNSGYFNTYIDSVWAKYNTDSPVITGENPDWRAAGIVDNSGVMKFKYTLGSWKGESVSISKPSSSNVFACDGVGSLKTDGSYPQSHQRLIPKVAGALNRNILLGFDASRGCDTATFYKRPVTNWFSKVLHLCALNNTCYGFPYDDDCEKSSLFPNGQVSVLNIEIGKFE
jgi:hypothetical protein